MDSSNNLPPLNLLPTKLWNIQSATKNCKADDILLSTIHQFCIGFGNEFTDFFNDDIFKIENLED